MRNGIKRIVSYFKNTDKAQIYLDIYAVLFIIGGFAALIFLTYKYVRWKC